MSQVHALQILTALHILAAAAFVGSNALVELLLRRLELVPPADAATIASKLGLDLIALNGTALAVAGATGIGRIFVSNAEDRYAEAGFWGTGYGTAMACMIGLWLTLVASAVALVFLRRRAIAKLPYDATREEIAGSTEAGMRAADWMRRLGWYNLVAGVALVVVGGFLKYGGFS